MAHGNIEKAMARLLPMALVALAGLAPLRPQAAFAALAGLVQMWPQARQPAHPQVHLRGGRAALRSSASWSCGDRSSSSSIAAQPPSSSGNNSTNSADTLLVHLRPLTSCVVLVLALALASLGSPGALAIDRAVAPPTCPSEPFKCRARQPEGAIQIAEQKYKEAKLRLREAEAALGLILSPGDLDYSSPYFGRAETTEFWRSELQRLLMNKEFLDEVRSTLAAERSQRVGVEAGSKSEALSVSARVGSTSPLRLVSRLAIEAQDVEQEARFWCEAIGMQRYGDAAGGGVLVGFGPPGIGAGDEGVFFAIEIRQAAPGSPDAKQRPSPGYAAKEAEAPSGSRSRLSFLQIAVPNQLRVYKITETGGLLLDGYGFYEVRSPAGVLVRAYIDDRRDPVEFVALAADDIKETGRQLEIMGLRPRGAYVPVSITQANMPDLPQGGIMYAGADPKKSPGILVLPLTERQFQRKEASSVTLGQDGNPQGNANALDEERPEAAYTPLSYAQSPKVVILGSGKGNVGGSSTGVSVAASVSTEGRRGSKSPLATVELQAARELGG